MLRVGTYNLLAPVYAKKWGEREGVDSHGKSNWPQRWLSQKAILESAALDIIFLQEIDAESLRSIENWAEGAGYAFLYFDHPGREDGLGFCFRKSQFSLIETKSEKLYGASARTSAAG
eukprot:GEMP01091400.1.p1 GENE.GEMP01091400.1~~GEMP01091400.1.p1  ORF type:complete len:118 (+),score=19.40 GEMP01091400.1:85-438(+)